MCGVWFPFNLSNYIVIHCVKKSLKRSVVGRGFIKNQAPGKLTSCQDDLPGWFDHLEESFLFSLPCNKKIINHPVEKAKKL